MIRTLYFTTTSMGWVPSLVWAVAVPIKHTTSWKCTTTKTKKEAHISSRASHWWKIWRQRAISHNVVSLVESRSRILRHQTNSWTSEESALPFSTKQGSIIPKTSNSQDPSSLTTTLRCMSWTLWIVSTRRTGQTHRICRPISNNRWRHWTTLTATSTWILMKRIIHSCKGCIALRVQ